MHFAYFRFVCFATCRNNLSEEPENKEIWAFSSSDECEVAKERLMNRVKAMLNGALTVAMLATGLGATTVSLAQEDADTPGEPLSEECKAFAADPNADVGDIIRAGCKPSIGQMAALMDNPLGNVAMLFTQLDFYVKKEPITGREDTQ